MDSRLTRECRLFIVDSDKTISWSPIRKSETLRKDTRNTCWYMSMLLLFYSYNCSSPLGIFICALIQLLYFPVTRELKNYILFHIKNMYCSIFEICFISWHKLFFSSFCYTDHKHNIIYITQQNLHYNVCFVMCVQIMSLDTKMM